MTVEVSDELLILLIEYLGLGADLYIELKISLGIVNDRHSIFIGDDNPEEKFVRGEHVFLVDSTERGVPLDMECIPAWK